MIEVWDVILPALTGDAPRRAYVYVPDSAAEDPGRRYPVLYMFDGHNVFFDEDATYGKSWGMGEYLDATGTELIVAAVECDHDPDNGRLKEYAPYPFSERSLGTIDSRGARTMDWLIQSFKREIDRDYPTLPDREHTFIAGSSMGALMSLYAVSSFSDTFSRAAALSPALECGPLKLEEMLRSADFPKDTVVYMDMGEKELSRRGAARMFRRVCDLLLKKGVKLTARIVPGGEHNEASWEKQLPFAIPVLLYDQED
ncbi:MAG: alpha/beta hydrolase [Oscillospiraceae bacterium]|nr:alpha/beta hydrolase [Oscillospiraceae bacterium]